MDAKELSLGGEQGIQGFEELRPVMRGHAGTLAGRAIAFLVIVQRIACACDLFLNRSKLLCFGGVRSGKRLS